MTMVKMLDHYDTRQLQAQLRWID